MNHDIHGDDIPFMPYAVALTERAQKFRREMTPAEQLFWEAVRDRRFRGLKFRRQKPLIEFIADFYCAELRLVVEIDGGVHEETHEYDRVRSEKLAEFDITVVRYRNEAVVNDISRVLAHLSAFVDAM